MRKIANILTKNIFNDKIFYNVVDKKENLIGNIPTLCVGIEMTKENYPEFNRINPIIDFNNFIMWTYGPREKRNIYESRLKAFIKDSIMKFSESITYKYLNVIIDGINSDDFMCVKSLIHVKNNGIISFIHNNMVYLYDGVDIVYGISLRDIQYIGGDVKKFLKNIYLNTTVITNKDSIPLDVRVFFNEKDYLVPCLFSNS